MRFNLKYMACAVAVMFASVSCIEDEGVVLPTDEGEQGWYVDPALDELWLNVKESADGFDTQQYFEFLLEATHLGWNQEYLRTALENASQAQVRTEGHINYGQLPRYVGGDIESASFDKNSILFALEFGALVRQLYYDKLDAENQALLDEFIDYAVYATINHSNVAVTYTNIFLMRAWVLISLGENLPSDRAWGRSLQVTPDYLAQMGYDMMRRWAADVKANGIHEHNSPTYAGVQAECLGYIARHTRNEEIRLMAQTLLEYFSAMLHATYFRTGMTMVGAQSRCYYRGTSAGKIDNIAAALLKGYGTKFYNTLALWEPTAEAKALNTTYPRTVCYKWGSEPQMNAVTYLDEKFAIGSVGRPYTGNANDKTFTIFLSSPTTKSVINVAHYLEGREDPYGKDKLASGITRNLQKYGVGRAQRDGEFVVMLSGDGSERNDTKALQSHIIVPVTNIDEVWIGDTYIANPLAESSRSIGGESKQSFFMRFEDVAVAIRYLLVEGCGGKTIIPSYISDSDGTSGFYTGSYQSTAMRLTARLSENTPAKGDNATVVMWWRVEPNITSDVEFEAFRHEVMNAEYSITREGDSFAVVVASPDGDLGFEGEFCERVYPQAVQENPASPDTKLYRGFTQTRTIGGVEAETYHFMVNGKDISTPILSNLTL